MYNLTVDEAHTFFVGSGDWLVHNVDCEKLFKKINTRTVNGEIRPAQLQAKPPGWQLTNDSEWELAQYGLDNGFDVYRSFQKPVDGATAGDFLFVKTQNGEVNGWIVELKSGGALSPNSRQITRLIFEDVRRYFGIDGSLRTGEGIFSDIKKLLGGG